MSIDKRAEKSFLQGFTEPVALEFAIKSYNTDEEILRILSENGFQATKDPNETDKILIAKDPEKVGIEYKAIITPPLNPKDVVPIFEILEKALEEAKCSLTSTPHIVDLKSITPRMHIPNDLAFKQQDIRNKYQNELIGNEKTFEEHMVNQALSSDKLITLLASYNEDIPSEIFQGYSRDELIFSGSTISDPYRTATQRVERNVRMASSDLINAIRYSHPESKKYCHYELYAGEQRYGFLHAYKVAPDQCYYDDVGIEMNTQPAYRGCSGEETAVNRFKNPCVGEYLVFKQLQGDQVFYSLFPIPQDDPHWQDFKTLLIHPNKTSLFAERYNILFEQKNNIQSIIPLNKDAYDENGYKSTFNENRFAKIKDELQNNKKTIESLIQDIENIKKAGQEIAASEIDLAEKKRKMRILEHESQKKKQEAMNLKEKILLRYNPIGNLAPLKEEIKNAAAFCHKVEPVYFNQQINTLERIAEDMRILRQKKIQDIDAHIDGHYKFSESTDLSFLRPEERKTMLEKIEDSTFKNINIHDVENSIKLYTSAQSFEERQDLFKYLDSIRLNISRNDKQLVSKISKQIKSDVRLKQYPELIELFKKDNIFVSHTAKARRFIYDLSNSHHK